MKRFLAEIIDSNYFYLSVLLFVIALPLSQALVSIAAGVMLITAFVEGSWESKIKRINENWVILFILCIFLLYILWPLLDGSWSNSLYDIRKSMFYIAVPLGFSLGKKISSKQKRFIFYVFSISIFISTLIAFYNWKFSDSAATFSVHSITLISHIRFSFQLILGFWFLLFLVYSNYWKLRTKQILIFSGSAFYFLLFLLFQQSLTGIISFISSCLLFMVLMIRNVKSRYRNILLLAIIVLIVIPIGYIFYVAKQFYTINRVEPENIELLTAEGNPYHHDFGNPMVENGHYVYLYVCEKEMREEWNKRSEVQYDSLDINGYPVKATLLRYLTSKGLRKDAEGVHALSGEDISNVENGIANVIFKNDGFSLYPRIYQTIWEYYVYTKTGYANNQSFSQRIEYAKAAVSIIENHFWLGVGPGNWKEEFKNAYQANHSTLEESKYASSHNQYLNYMVKFGIIGFILILFFFVYPVIKTKRYSDHLFLLFLVFMFFSNFADSNLESHMGSSFFVFFYCVFVITDGTDYLYLHKNSKNKI